MKTLTFDLVFGAGLNNGLKRDPVLSSDAGVGLNSGLKRGLNKLMAWLVTLGIASLWPSAASEVGLLLGFKNPGLRGLSKSAVSTIDQINSLKYLLFVLEHFAPFILFKGGRNFSDSFLLIQMALK